ERLQRFLLQIEIGAKQYKLKALCRRAPAGLLTGACPSTPGFPIVSDRHDTDNYRGAIRFGIRAFFTTIHPVLSPTVPCTGAIASDRPGLNGRVKGVPLDCAPATSRTQPRPPELCPHQIIDPEGGLGSRAME